jgi:nucleoside-diphosphate-sugar epimerase
MEKILVTGAAGGIGTRLRKLLKGIYPAIRWSDIRKPDGLANDEDFMAADLAAYAQVERIAAGVDDIVHLGGHSTEGSWDTIHNANIVGCYNVFEAAYRQGVKRVVFASSNHAVGFYPREQRWRQCDGTPGQPLRREQGVRRSARRALCRQARLARYLSAHRQCRRCPTRQAAAFDLAQARGPSTTVALSSIV